MAVVTTNYPGVWNMAQQMQAIAAGNWTNQKNLYGWGYNGSTNLSPIAGNKSSATAVSNRWNTNVPINTGYSFASSIFINTDDTLWAWGANAYGQLGNSTSTTVTSPVQIGSDTWTMVSPSQTHTLAIKSNGTLWAWGYNAYGSLGLGNTTNYSSPKQVGALTDWIYVSAGVGPSGGTSFGIRSDHSLWAWGDNTSYGQLGFNNLTNYSSPKQIGSNKYWLYVAAGEKATAAINLAGALFLWGRNSSGQLGLGNTTHYSSPMQIGGGSTAWTKIYAGTSRFFAVQGDNTLWGWGYQTTNGELGNNGTTSRSSPVQIGATTTWRCAADTGFGGVAIQGNGTLWGWGNNSYGQLFTNPNPSISPVRLGSLSTWIAVTGGQYCALGLTSAA